MRKILVILMFLFSSSLFSQTLIQTYVDRCTGAVQVFSVPMNGSTVVSFYNKSRTFTYQEFQNGTLQAWLEETWLWWQALSPCSTTTTNVTTTTTQTTETVNQATEAATNATNVANQVNVPDTTVPDTSIPDTSIPDTSVPDTSVPDTSVPDTSVPDTEVPDTSIPDTEVDTPDIDIEAPEVDTPEVDTEVDTPEVDTEAPEVEAPAETEVETPTESTETADTSTETETTETTETETTETTETESTETESTETESTETESTESESTESESTESESTEESTEETTEESTEESTEEETTEESTEEESTEEESTEEEEEESNEEESDNEDTEEEDKKREKRQFAPPVIMSNVLAQQSPTGEYNMAAMVGYSQSTLIGTESFGANLMVYDNLEQFMLNLSYTKVHINDQGRANRVYSLGLGGSKMFTTYMGNINNSFIWLGEKGSVKGLAFGTSFSSFELDVREGVVYFEDVLLSNSLTGFITKPYKWNDRLTISPMLAISSPFFSMSMSNYDTTWNTDVMAIGGMNFNYMFTQRFGLTLGTTVIESTIPQFPTLTNFMLGGRFSF